MKDQPKKRRSKSAVNFVIGKNALNEILKHKPERLKCLYLTKDKDTSHPLYKLANQNEIKVRFVSKHVLSEISASDSHQGIGGELYPRENLNLNQLLSNCDKEKSTLMVAISEIFDPQNLGTILRASECFGISGVIWSKNRGVSITPAAAKASVGASELVPFSQVANLAEAIREMKKKGYTAIAADVSDDAIALPEFSFPEKSVLILGSEGMGIRELLKKLSDVSIVIPLSGKIDSLNVSQAASVIFSHWAFQRGLYS